MKRSTRRTLGVYLFHLKPYKRMVFLLLSAVTSASILGVTIPIFYKKFFDILTADGSPSELLPLILHVLWIIAAFKMLEWIVWRVAIFANNNVQPRVVSDLANYCFAYLHKHSFSFFHSNFVGSLVKRVTRFNRVFESIADRVIWNLIPLIVNVLTIFLVIVTRNITLGFIILGWILLFGSINILLAQYKQKFDLERSQAETKSTAVLADTITNQSNVKLFNGYKREMDRFAKVMEEVRRLRKFTWDLDAWFETVQILLMIVLEIGIMYLAIRLWHEGALTVGDFVLFQTYLMNIFNRVWDFGRLFRDTYENLAEAEEMTEVLDTPNEIVNAVGAVPLIVSKGNIVFDNVSFCYHKTRQVISNLNLTISGGEKVALVGPSGAGKSTIVKLLLRQYDLTEGHIFIDKQEIAKVTTESLWQSISLVPQDPVLFHRSLMENIRYGKPEASVAEVFEAAKLANCHEFISNFPEKYETYVGERGVKLSGGERQRVAIGRAILQQAPILILDEATSSLDSESESLIQGALDNLMKNKTVIVIAHRLSTIMKMDRIVVVDEGRVKEEGSHNDLIKIKNGLYRHLWEIQSGGFIE